VQLTPTFDLNTLAEAVAAKLAERLRAEQDRLLDRAQLAERLGVSERTVSTLVARGELPGPLLHTSGISRWGWSEVECYLASRRQRTLRKGRGRYNRNSEGVPT
jgi:predicted DNA-binding transcriptional regulator AlpA